MNCNSSLSSSNFNCGLLFSNVKSFMFWYSNFMTNRHVYFGIGVQLQSWNSKIIPNLIMIKLLNLQDSFWYCACLTKDHKLRINYGSIDENGKSGANVYRTKSVTRPACLSDGNLNIPRELGHYHVCRCPAPSCQPSDNVLTVYIWQMLRFYNDIFHSCSCEASMLRKWNCKLVLGAFKSIQVLFY